jgi:hypothetical protein
MLLIPEEALGEQQRERSLLQVMPPTPEEASSSHFLSIAEHEKCGRALRESAGMRRGRDVLELHLEMLDHHSLAKQDTVCYTATSTLYCKRVKA